MEQPKPLPHRLAMEGRSRLTLTGAREVIRFEADQVEVDTALGVLTVLGSELRLKCLSLEEGTLIIQGTVTGLLYDEGSRRRGWFR